MFAARTIRHAFVLALAAWMSLCCCEKRILAHALDAPTARGHDCCARACCADDAGDAPSQRGGSDEHPANCADGCCAKSCSIAPPFVPDLDTIGAPVVPVLVHRDDTLEQGRALAHEDRTAGEPPPRLALVISRRLRI